MKRKIGTRHKRKRSQKTKKQRGGGNITFKVIVFSKEKLSPSDSQSLLDSLKELYGIVTIEKSEIPHKYMFPETTGIAKLKNADTSMETVISIKTPPAFLEKNINPDTLITALEGQIHNKLTEKGITISLIPVQHGAYSVDGRNKTFYVGLCSPKCFTVDGPIYLSKIESVVKL